MPFGGRFAIIHRSRSSTRRLTLPSTRLKSESEQALRVNRDGAALLAAAASAADAPFIHISTDYVFDGTKRIPYREDDPIAPLGAYGLSKAEGEHAVRENMRKACHLAHVVGVQSSGHELRSHDVASWRRTRRTPDRQ